MELSGQALRKEDVLLEKVGGGEPHSTGVCEDSLRYCGGQSCIQRMHSGKVGIYERHLPDLESFIDAVSSCIPIFSNVTS